MADPEKFVCVVPAKSVISNYLFFDPTLFGILILISVLIRSIYLLGIKIQKMNCPYATLKVFEIIREMYSTNGVPIAPTGRFTSCDRFLVGRIKHSKWL